jgi:hypothetical protein
MKLSSPSIGPDSKGSMPYTRTATWAPDGDRLYLCQAPGSLGYVIPLNGDQPTLHTPCMAVSAWSPDGKLLAGNLDNKLLTWNPADAAP